MRMSTVSGERVDLPYHLQCENTLWQCEGNLHSFLFQHASALPLEGCMLPCRMLHIVALIHSSRACWTMRGIHTTRTTQPIVLTVVASKMLIGRNLNILPCPSFWRCDCSAKLQFQGFMKCVKKPWLWFFSCGCWKYKIARLNLSVQTCRILDLFAGRKLNIGYKIEKLSVHEQI